MRELVRRNVAIVNFLTVKNLRINYHTTMDLRYIYKPEEYNCQMNEVVSSRCKRNVINIIIITCMLYVSTEQNVNNALPSVSTSCSSGSHKLSYLSWTVKLGSWFSRINRFNRETKTCGGVCLYSTLTYMYICTCSCIYMCVLLCMYCFILQL